MTGFSFLAEHCHHITPLPTECQSPDFRSLNPLTQIYYFGSFNPVHLGHLNTAKEALAALSSQGFREVIFIPTPKPPNKMKRSSQNELLPLPLRLAFLNDAIHDLGMQNYFKALNLEWQSDDSPSYTAQTIEKRFKDFFQEAPDARLYLLMGEETLMSLPTWYNAEWLLQHIHCVVMPRPTHFKTPFRKEIDVLLKHRYQVDVIRLRPSRVFPMNATQLRQQGDKTGWLTSSVHPFFIVH
jgi:nicotinate-nucleotide adenylyltransferase